MKTNLDVKVETLLMEKLCANQINYFSFTRFHNKKPVISHCNHPRWLEYYNKQYDLKPPPVQKYILGSKLRILSWNFEEIDKESRAFIKERNEMVESSENISLLFPDQNQLTVITLGTKKKFSHLLQFVNDDLESLLLMEKNFL